MTSAFPILAAATQEEVLRSISSNFDQSVDPMKFFAGLLGVIGSILLLAWVAHHRSRAGGPKQLNHPGKLLREMTKKTGLKPAELKKLKALAEEADVSSPIVLLLCPSVMSATLKRRAER